VVSEPRVMMADGSLRVSNNCDVTVSESATSRKAQWKGKSRAPMPLAVDNKLKPKIYMGFLTSFVHKELFIRNTKETIVEDYDVPEVISHTRTSENITSVVRQLLILCTWLP